MKLKAALCQSRKIQLLINLKTEINISRWNWESQKDSIVFNKNSVHIIIKHAYQFWPTYKIKSSASLFCVGDRFHLFKTITFNHRWSYKVIFFISRTETTMNKPVNNHKSRHFCNKLPVVLLKNNHELSWQ